MAPLGDGGSHGVGHLELLWSRLVIVQPTSDRSAGTEDGCKRHA
jgi:hypothetical protein